MKFIAAMLATGASALYTAEHHMPEFLKWVLQHDKNYETRGEFEHRFETWVRTHLEIREINAREGNTFTVGHNKFSDWTAEDWANFNTWRPNPNAKNVEAKELPTDNLPSEIDWRDKGAVNPIQDQGNCGSCWAFSAIASMEGTHFITSGKLEKLSEQQCVDCDTDSYGCSGGWQDNCMWYVFDNGGLNTEEDYPYTAATGFCTADWNTGPVTVSEVNPVKGHMDDQLMAAIANGPTSVTIDASSTVFHNYTGGVINDSSCGTSLDHAVTAVGYGTDPDGGDYYLVRNSR